MTAKRSSELDPAVSRVGPLGPEGLLEFVPREDRPAREMLPLGEDVSPDDTETAFLAAPGARARFARTERVSSTGRPLACFDRS